MNIQFEYCKSSYIQLISLGARSAEGQKMVYLPVAIKFRVFELKIYQ